MDHIIRTDSCQELQILCTEENNLTGGYMTVKQWFSNEHAEGTKKIGKKVNCNYSERKENKRWLRKKRK